LLKFLQNSYTIKSYASPHIIMVIKSRRMRWTGHVAHTGEMKNTYIILVGKLEGNWPLGTPRRWWEDNIRMDLGENNWKVWTGCIWLRLGTSGGPLWTR